MSVFALFGVFGPLFRVNEGSLNKPRLEDPVMELGDRAADAAGGLMKTLELLLGAYEGVGGTYFEIDTRTLRESSCKCGEFSSSKSTT